MPQPVPDPPPAPTISQSQRDAEERIRGLQLDAESNFAAAGSALAAFEVAEAALNASAPDAILAATTVVNAAEIALQANANRQAQITAELNGQPPPPDNPASAPPLADYARNLRIVLRGDLNQRRTAMQASHPGQNWEPKGFLRDAPDDRDRLYSPPATAGQLPARVDLRSLCPPIYQQVGGSCTSNAVAGAIQFSQLKLRQPAPEPAPQFLYYNARLIAGQELQYAGTSIRQNLKAAARLGLPAYPAWPNRYESICVRPGPEAYGAAQPQTISSYARVRLKLDHIRACLAEGFPVVAAFNVFNTPEDDGVVVLPPEPQIAALALSGEGHTVLLVGYDDSAQTFCVRNSWGTNWGYFGYGTVPYTYVLDPRLTDNLWTIRNETAAPGAPAGTF